MKNVRVSCVALGLLGLLLCGRSNASDAPEISRSTGVEGGVIVFWPRIIPRSETVNTRALAKKIQARLKTLVTQALPGRPLDVRPEPERVCPQAGCQAMTVGVLLARKGSGCIAVALLGRPGKALTHLVPWVGKVKVKQEWVPFRKPPESFLTINDFTPCDQVMAQLPANENQIIKMIKDAEPARKKK
ncbi:MAG: hypothetical protein JRJ19_12615 [Deltaproteobacteria bacterium]|nr:hypothetical protein [Deltaproteobacteria bacterium]MBW1872905.1 hypothetical protein [Deltaproteobacteria bacterium]